MDLSIADTVKQTTEKIISPAQYWCPPHLIPMKDASPREIWLKDIGKIPEISTITLTVHAVGQPYNGNNTAAIKSMMIDVLPPYIEYQGTWTPTPNNNATIKNFQFIQGLGAMWELRWDVPKMKINDVFEVQYDIKSTQLGWQSVGVTSTNSTLYGSDYCRVIYQNWQYYMTNDSKDIWTNETNDVSIFVKDSVISDITIAFLPVIGFMLIFYIIRRK